MKWIGFGILAILLTMTAFSYSTNDVETNETDYASLKNGVELFAEQNTGDDVLVKCGGDEEKKCGEGEKKDKKKCGEGDEKCGEGKCGDGGDDEKCGEGKCGEGSDGE